MAVALERLKNRRDFLRVAATQRKWVTPGLILQAAPSPVLVCPHVEENQAEPVEPKQQGLGRESARVGFTVTKKVGNSVKRNRARRRLRAAAAALMGDLATPGHDYVLIGRIETIDRPYEALLEDLRTALARVLTAKPSPYAPRKGMKARERGKRRENGSPASPLAPPSVSPPMDAPR